MLESLQPAWWLKLEARKEFWWPEAATITALTILMTLFSLTSPQRNGRSVIFTRRGCGRIFSRNGNIVFQTLEAKLNTPRMRMKMVDVSEVPTVIGGYYNSLLDTIEEFDGKSWVLWNFFFCKSDGFTLPPLFVLLLFRHWGTRNCTTLGTPMGCQASFLRTCSNARIKPTRRGLLTKYSPWKYLRFDICQYWWMLQLLIITL